MKCTNCNKELEDVKISIRLNIKMERKTENDTWDNIPNGALNPEETLCTDCFSLFAETLGSVLNKVDKIDV